MNTVQDKQRKVLGRGLSALLPPKPVTMPRPESEAGLKVISISQIEPNHLQPRTVFDPTRLQ